MIYELSTDSDPPYNNFHSIRECWEQSESLYDPNVYLELLSSNNPYRGKSFKENWIPLKVELYSKAKSRRLLDICNVHDARCPVFSEKARDVLSEFLEENGEFLPIYCVDNDKTYYMYNVLTYVDILDHEKNLRYLYFKKDIDFDKLSIFKILSKRNYLVYRSNIYLSQKVIERIIKYKLKGLLLFIPEYADESVTNKDLLESFIEFNKSLNIKC